MPFYLFIWKYELKHLLLLQSAAKSLDFIIDTASGDHPFDPYLFLLKFDGIMVLVGFPSEIKISPFALNFG
jgi:cinnamyl-alcohol dehydrogenase